MSVKRYRVNEATIAMFHDEGRGVARTVPAGTIIELHGGTLEGDRLVEVMWDGKPVMLFT